MVSQLICFWPLFLANHADIHAAWLLAQVLNLYFSEAANFVCR